MLDGMDLVGTAAPGYRAPDAPRSPDQRIAALAAAQHGVVGRGQLTALGLSDSAVGRRVAAGRLHRVHRGVYAVGHPVLGPNGHRLAAVLACGPAAVLSHASAAGLWGIRPDNGSRVDVTVVGGSCRRSRRLRVHRARALPAAERAVRDAIPVTSPARTVLDLAPTLSERALERMLDRVEVERLTDVRTILATVAANHGHHGSGPLRRTLAQHVPGTTLTRSRLEERVLALCRAHGLPRPLVNHPVLGLEVDFVFPDGVLVEADSWRYHHRPAAFARDRERDGMLVRAGYRVLRFSDEQIVGDPGAVARTIAAALDGRGASGAR
jgi:hypothetical protein